jgi:hypothetical protein
MPVTSDSEALARHVAIDDRDVVDVGCGPGGFAVAMAARGARVTGVEISEGQLAAARERVRDDHVEVALAVGRAEDLPLRDASMDLVVFMRSLHHVPVQRMGDALRETRRVLRPGGAVWIVEPLPEGDFFEMVSLIDDETDARAAANSAIEHASDQALGHELRERYELATIYKDVEQFRGHMGGVDPARAPRFDAQRELLARRFAAGGEPFDDEGARYFVLPHRADLLRRSY